jgi:NAD(P)-dependent dehydrogenase (short-subunit alcohol dehydrogenase family)
MDLGLRGKVAVVTGGSRGIGKAIATALAAEGADLALIARGADPLRAAAAEIAASSGVRAEGFASDTGNDSRIRDAFAAIAQRFGRIDILVNCAAQPGGQGKPPGLNDISEQDLWADMNVKVLGYLRCAREAVPHMERHGWGRIINISGLAARQTGTIIGSIRNVGVAALTKNLADELGPRGINVTCVHPGLTRTEKTPAVLKRQAEAAGVNTDEIERRIASRNLIRRMVDAREVADVVAFLASPKSAAITGDAIAVGGGTPLAIYY